VRVKLPNSPLVGKEFSFLIIGQKGAKVENPSQNQPACFVPSDTGIREIPYFLAGLSTLDEYFYKNILKFEQHLYINSKADVFFGESSCILQLRMDNWKTAPWFGPGYEIPQNRKR